MGIKSRKAFTLVELLIAMAIIAVLISIAAYGIQIVQRNARNTVRRSINQNLEVAIRDVSASDASNRANWVSFNTSTNLIELKSSSASTIVLNTLPIRDFKDIVIQTNVACTGNNDSSGYGAPESSPSRLWLCFNPKDQTHGVRLENGIGIAQVLSLGKIPMNVGGKVNYNVPGAWTHDSVSKIEHMTDGNSSTYLAVQTNFGTQATINLDSPQNISNISYDIFWDTRFGSQANVIFYTSNDNSTWTALPTQTVSNNAGPTSFNVPSGTSAQYVKFVWASPPSGSGSWNGWGGVREITVK